MKKLNVEKLRENVLGSIERDLAASKIAGAAVMVAERGKILLDERVGYRNIRTGEPLERNAMFRLASMTKPITGFAFLIGIERGYFKYDDRLVDHFPEFAGMPIGRVENDRVVYDRMPKNDILLYQLLSNSSGFMCASPVETIQKAALPDSAYASARTKIDACLDGMLCFEPGEGYGYSQSAAYDVIALLIEKYSKMSYADFIRENIFAPLGIKDITYNPTAEQWSRFVTMHDKLVNVGMATVDMGNRIFEGNPIEYTSAGAGLAGSIEDYFRFADMLRMGGEWCGKRLVSKETFSLYARPAVDKKYMGAGATNSWGAGVRVTLGHKVLPDGSFGWSGAYGTHFFIEPECGIVGVYMKNNRWYDAHGAGKTGAQFEIDVMSALE